MDDKKVKLYEDIIGYSLNCFEFHIAENYLIIYTAKNDFNSVSKVLKNLVEKHYKMNNKKKK